MARGCGDFAPHMPGMLKLQLQTYREADAGKLKHHGQEDIQSGKGTLDTGSADLQEQRQGRTLGLGSVVARGTGEEGEDGNDNGGGTDREREEEGDVDGDLRRAVLSNASLVPAE